MDYRIFNVRTNVNACGCARGCTDTVRESALNVDSGRKIPCRTGESNLHQRRDGSMLYQWATSPPPTYLLTVNTAQTLLSSFVLSKWYHCNSLFSGSPQYILDQLQRVQSSAARLVVESRKCDHIKPLLSNLHWVPVGSRIDKKIWTLCFSTFTHFSPIYIYIRLHPF